MTNPTTPELHTHNSMTTSGLFLTKEHLDVNVNVALPLASETLQLTTSLLLCGLLEL
jgi:hypothetical protein